MTRLTEFCRDMESFISSPTLFWGGPENSAFAGLSLVSSFHPGCESRQISLLFLLELFAPPLLQRPVAAKVEGSGFLAVQNFINRKQTRKKYAN